MTDGPAQLASLNNCTRAKPAFAVPAHPAVEPASAGAVLSATTPTTVAPRIAKRPRARLGLSLPFGASVRSAKLRRNTRRLGSDITNSLGGRATFLLRM